MADGDKAGDLSALVYELRPRTARTPGTSEACGRIDICDPYVVINRQGLDEYRTEPMDDVGSYAVFPEGLLPIARGNHEQITGTYRVEIWHDAISDVLLNTCHIEVTDEALAHAIYGTAENPTGTYFVSGPCLTEGSDSVSFSVRSVERVRVTIENRCPDETLVQHGDGSLTLNRTIATAVIDVPVGTVLEVPNPIDGVSDLLFRQTVTEASSFMLTTTAANPGYCQLLPRFATP